MRSFAPWLVLALVASAGKLPAALGEDFRIETKLFEGGADKPTSENITLFRAGVVYDYLVDPAEVTVFDPARARFILLDPDRRVRTEIGTSNVQDFVAKLQRWGAGHPEAFLKFQAEPTFDVQAAESSNTMTFKSPWMTYAITAEPARSEESARQYGEFCDWYARLNSLTSHTLLPFPRLRVNAELKRRQLMPREVALTISNPSSFPKQMQDRALRTEHSVTWVLSRSDLRRIEQTAEDLVNFKRVNFAEYHPPATSEKGSAE